MLIIELRKGGLKMDLDIEYSQEEKQELFEKFLNASFELKAELISKLFDDQAYLTDKEEEFIFALKNGIKVFK